ncbi:MAG TPA: hypothetical protein ENN29_05655 [Candidatus Hydrogenedentes bacterium]|nr:hypothetical protein [Candidatus Hydrogenedentota bacterium]
MDLSGLKWPLIIVVIVGIAFLASSPGVNYMVNNFTKAAPGQDPERDRIDEAGLTRVGGYLMYLWHYERAMAVMQMAIDRYGPEGANYWYNKYRIARCLDRLHRYKASYDVLQELINVEASQYDNRVPGNDNLRARAAKLKEVHELP